MTFLINLYFEDDSWNINAFKMFLLCFCFFLNCLFQTLFNHLFIYLIVLLAWVKLKLDWFTKKDTGMQFRIRSVLSVQFGQSFNPIALRMAKTPLSFGHLCAIGSMGSVLFVTSASLCKISTLVNHHLAYGKVRFIGEYIFMQYLFIILNPLKMCYFKPPFCSI